MRKLLSYFAIFFLVVGVTGCGSGAHTSMIDVDGSSTVFPITEAMAEEFQKKHPNTRVIVGISGTGGGFKRFCRKETHVNNASRSIKESEEKLCAENEVQYVELPVAYDGLAVVVHADNTWVDYLTVTELRKMWEPAAQDTITRWNQIRPEWPDEPIGLYGAGVDSGTYDYFTEAIVGESGESRGDFVASEDDNVIVQGISRDVNAIGFFGYAYYKENKDKLKIVPIAAADDGGRESAVTPTVDTINNGTYAPLSRPLFLYVSQNAAQQPEVDAFVRFYLDPTNAEELVSEVGYVPLPARLYRSALRQYEAIVPDPDSPAS